MTVGFQGWFSYRGDTRLGSGLLSTRNNSDSGTPQQTVPCFLAQVPLGRGVRLGQEWGFCPHLAWLQDTAQLENQPHASSQGGLAQVGLAQGLQAPPRLWAFGRRPQSPEL